MGKKSKKANSNNNAKKNKEESNTKAEEIEISKPSAPETLPHPLPDSGTIGDHLQEDEIPNPQPEVDDLEIDGPENQGGAQSGGEEQVVDGELSGQDIVVVIEDVVDTPTIPREEKVEIAVEEDVSDMPTSVNTIDGEAAVSTSEQHDGRVQGEDAQPAPEEALNPERSENSLAEVNTHIDEPARTKSDSEAADAPESSIHHDNGPAFVEEEIVQRTADLGFREIPLDPISHDGEASGPAPELLSVEEPIGNREDNTEETRSTVLPSDAIPIHASAETDARTDQPMATPSRSPAPRELLSPRSKARSPSPSISHDGSEAGPSRRQSGFSSPRSSHNPMSPSFRSNLTSPIKSPRPTSFFAQKPSLPISAPIVITNGDDMEEVIDDSAPFESIPLQATPPPVLPATLPSSPRLHPGSPTSLKRNSWSGFGKGKTERHDGTEGLSGHIEPVDTHSRSSISTIPPPRPSSIQSPSDEQPASTDKTEPPRLHAPPAHPHPFPVPTPNSPRPSHESRPSHSGPSVPPPGAGPSVALGVKGVSTFEKVISHTRPSWLPPKDRAEDETHYHQWEEMMSQAREMEKGKRKAEEAKRVERDKRLAINTPKWEEMLDEKTFSADRIRKDPALRNIWFEGAPTYLRGKAWSLAIGNPLALSKDLYKSCVVRSQKAIASGRFPAEILDRIEKDLDQTLVNLHLFQHGSPLRADLHELICAWVVYRSDTAQGYASYINLLAAMFLLSSPPATAFLSLINLLSRPVLRAFYSDTRDEIDAFYRVFENLQADMFPKIFANCKNLGLKVPESWFRSVLVEQVPFEATCRLWDQIVLDGDGYIFRSALAIFGFLEPRLYFPDRDEIESVLEGRNHATQAIVDREKERAKLRGETYLDELDGKLSVFGLNEQALFDWLANDGWKEARFERLVTREMPD